MKGKDDFLLEKAKAYIMLYGGYTILLMSRYEILRGLKAKKAFKKVEEFEKSCLTFNILPITDAVIVKAADVYADLKNAGQLIGDGDIFIASTALVHNLVLVTNNVRHFSRIPGLMIDNWKQVH
jgi:tRNA(fMet)-specific endonuclease VapC